MINSILTYSIPSSILKRCSRCSRGIIQPMGWIDFKYNKEPAAQFKKSLGQNGVRAAHRE